MASNWTQLPEETQKPEGFGGDCAYSGCHKPGLHRAPRSRESLRDYLWLCLDHVREYNLSWNYYAGMTEAEVERERRGDTVWHRPTWPLGRRGWTNGAADPFGLFKDGRRPEWARQDQRETPEDEAFATLGLTPPVTMAGLKRRYKELVKRHHPDANGGDKDAEEKLKFVNHAYGLLVKALSHSPSAG